MIKKEKGFAIVTILLTISILIVLMSIWGGSSSNSNLTLSADIQATNIINDGLTIKLSYDKLLMAGAPADKIEYIPNYNSPLNMLDPTTGIVLPKTNSAALMPGLTFPLGSWIMNPNKLIGNNIGTGSPDPAVLIQGIKESVCRRINYNLHGSTNIPSFGFVGYPATLVSNAIPGYPITDIANQLYFLNGISGWMNGCISGGNDPAGIYNFYYQILRPV